MRLPPRADISQCDTIRLISTGRLKEPVLLPLADNHGALKDLAELEGVTSGRLQAQEGGLPGLDPRELGFGRPGYTFINAAFAYTRPGGNRFNDDNRGAWYGACEAETALAEVSFHLTRELEAINRFDNVTDYAELVADAPVNSSQTPFCIRIRSRHTPRDRRWQNTSEKTNRVLGSSIRRYDTRMEPASQPCIPILCRTSGRAAFGA